jgi:hypothetical protein
VAERAPLHWARNTPGPGAATRSHFVAKRLRERSQRPLGDRLWKIARCNFHALPTTAMAANLSESFLDAEDLLSAAAGR